MAPARPGPVSLPLFLVPSLPAGDTCRLDGPEGHHAATVARLRAGERLLLADGTGACAAGVVTAVGRGVLDIAIERRWVEPEPAPRFVVVQALAKGDRAELAVQAMTEVGVDELVPWAASRSVVQWRGERGDRALERWRSVAREAAKQSRRVRLPVVTAPAGTADVARRLAGATAGYVLHEDAGTPLASLDPPVTGEVVLVVGPEGGISAEEVEAFTAAGATAVRLGTTVLRTSTAGVAALAVLNARTSRWC